MTLAMQRELKVASGAAAAERACPSSGRAVAWEGDSTSPRRTYGGRQRSAMKARECRSGSSARAPIRLVARRGGFFSPPPPSWSACTPYPSAARSRARPTHFAPGPLRAASVTVHARTRQLRARPRPPPRSNRASVQPRRKAPRAFPAQAGSRTCLRSTRFARTRARP